MRPRTLSRLFFEGPAAGLMVKRLAKNRDAEQEAVVELAPAPTDHVLAIGFGPGIGVQSLAERMPDGRVVGVDPSSAMLKAATRLNYEAVTAGRVELVKTTADRLPWNDATFDGAITVNTIQLWDPFEPSVAEVARVLRLGGRLVSFTHDWAIKMSTRREVDEWVRYAGEVCAAHGLTDARHWRAEDEEGRSVAFVGRKCQA